MSRMSQDKYTPKDFQSDQEVKWCPGCGDFAILKQVQSVLPEIGIPKENIVFISGIGCSSRFPYYMNTYGMHSIHGRAPAIASGLKLSRPELSVWVITGDGDGLSIGGNHLLHVLRRNIDLNILLFNNEIYGLTKGQFSPTSQLGLVTKSSPTGVKDSPIHPLQFALGAGAHFIARTIDREPRHIKEVLLQAENYRGTSFVEIYQNCLIFNDGAFDEFTGREVRDENVLFVEDGKPLIFGKNRDKGIKMEGLKPIIVELTENFSENQLLTHDSSNPLVASILTRFGNKNDDFFEDFPCVFGIIFAKKADTRVEHPEELKKFDIQQLISGQKNWVVNSK